MGIFDYFPYANLHELNLDWIIRLVRQFINDSQIEFKSIEDELSFLKNNFNDLKDYVASYFDSLDVKKEVSDKLEQMLEDGELEDILGSKIITWNAPRQQTLNGRITARERKNRYVNPLDSNSPTISMQNGTIYSTSGDYSYNGVGRYLYYYEVLSDESQCDLVVYDLNNQRVSGRVGVNHGKHGGCLSVKDGKLYSICTDDNYLYVWDILTDPTSPSLEIERAINLTAKNLIGYYKAGETWLCAKDYENGQREVYRVDDEFTTETFLYTVDTSGDMISQDWDLDSDNGIIYQAQTWGSNIITAIDVVTGEILNNFEVPKHISYALTGEIEYIFGNGKYIYYGGISVAGAPNSLVICYNNYYTDLSKLNEARHIQGIQSGSRTAMVSTAYSPLNPPYTFTTGTNRNMRFRYIEDALLYAEETAGSTIISLASDYDYSFRVFADCRLNLNNHNLRAFVVDNTVNVMITGLRGSFSGAPISYTYDDLSSNISCYIYIGYGARVSFTRIDEIPVNSEADVMIWSQYATIYLHGRNGIQNIFASHSIIESAGYIDENTYSWYSLWIVGGVWINNGDKMYFDDNSIIKSNGITTTNNPRIPLQSIYSKYLPKPARFQTGTGANSQYRPVGELFIYGLSSQTIYYGYWSSTNTWESVEATLNYNTVTSPVGGFNARRWSITGTVPSAIASYQGIMTFN